MTKERRDARDEHQAIMRQRIAMTVGSATLVMRSATQWLTQTARSFSLRPGGRHLAGPTRGIEARVLSVAGRTAHAQTLGVEFTPLTITTATARRLRAWHLPRAIAAGASRLLSRQRRQSFALDRRLGRPLAPRDGRRRAGLPRLRSQHRSAVRTRPVSRRRCDAARSSGAPAGRSDAPTIYWGRSLGTPWPPMRRAGGRPTASCSRQDFRRCGRCSKPTRHVGAVVGVELSIPTAEWMASVQAPALVLHGDRDNVIPYRLGTAPVRSAAGPEALRHAPRRSITTTPFPPTAALLGRGARLRGTDLRYPHAQPDR